jgi:hypothetical protein
VAGFIGGFAAFGVTQLLNASANPGRAHPPSTRADRIVSDYVAVTRRALDWRQPPTIHQPSVAYFKTHLSSLDPETPHKFKVPAAAVSTDVFSLIQRAPQLSGTLLRVTGRLAQPPLQVQVHERASSWAFFLRDPGVPRVLAVCRVPLARGDEEGYSVGDVVHANGLLLADGATERIDGKGVERVAYLACGAVAKRVGLVTIRGRRRK